MKRAWIAAALLAASWLLGLSYYHAASWVAWALLVGVGVVLMGGLPERRIRWPVALVSAALLAPVAVLAPWPQKAAVLLLGAGLLLHGLSIPRRWPTRLATAMLAAGAVLLVQAVAMAAYESFTARRPDLPDALTRLLAWLGGLAGFDLSVEGSNLALFSMRRVHRLGATWALLADPVTVCFLVGGVVLIALERWAASANGQRGGWRRLAPMGRFAAAVALWLPLRALILTALYMHRALRTGYDDPLDLMNQFWSPWVHLVLLAGPVLLAWRFVRPSGKRDDAPPVRPAGPKWQPAAAAVVALLAVAALTAGIAWDPVGERKGGRILVDERRSQLPWPGKTFDSTRTDRPFDRDWYGHASSYNYACLYDYCSRFYTMSRLDGTIGDDALRDCDVLFLKVPSGPYSPTEIAAIRRFVNRGGGVLLLGEHTNFGGSGVHLNQIAQTFGFRFRYDCAFGMDSVFRQRYTPALAPHPVVQHTGPIDFATSCTLDVAGAGGRAVIQDTGLKNLHADYHVSNYYPQAENHPHMRYGAFVQLWAARDGAGRVLAFTDSTIFSDFAFFEPGKSELMLGMLEWLNHRNRLFDPRALLVLIGALLAAGVLALGRPCDANWPLLVAAGALGWLVAIVGVRAAHRAAMPLPKALRPMVRVTMDRTVSAAPLPRNGFIAGKDDAFGLFERSILRLGYFTRRASGEAVTDARLVVVLHPSRTVTPAFGDRLVEYVAGGGQLLVLDSPENAASTANSLLHPFGLEVRRTARLRGLLEPQRPWPVVAVPSAWEVRGGEVLARIAGRPVAAVKRHGKGAVWVVGFASRFTDARMGVIGDVVPTGELRKVYDLEYALLEAIVEAAPTTRPATAPASPRAASRPATPRE